MGYVLSYIFEWFLWRIWFVEDYFSSLVGFHFDWWREANEFRRNYP